MEEKNNEKVEEKKVENELSVENSGITISDDAIAVIAGKAVSEVSGISNMAGGFAGGITEVLSGKKNLAKGIKVDSETKNLKIDVHIIVDYGVRIPDIAFDIQNRVKKNVEAMTGLKVQQVNVHVQGVNTGVDKDNNEKSETEA